MGGLLIPPWYVAEATAASSRIWLVPFLFGFSTACGAFCLVTIVHQAYRTWQRSKQLATHPYIILITLEWTSSVVISIVSYLFLNSVIPPSFWLFFGILCLWVIQIQCLMQIIINRIALIMYDGRRVGTLKWTVAGLVGLINLSVFVIWMPARLQISPTWMALNSVWDRIEKGLLALIDLGLNLKFIHLVHTELIRHGLTKYRDLYRFNVTMIFISISLDIVLIGIMSLPNESSFVYVQFHPLMYLIKLKIEMNLADLIVKIVRATAPPPDHVLHRYAADAGATNLSSSRHARPSQTRNNTDTSKGTGTTGTTITGNGNANGGNGNGENPTTVGPPVPPQQPQPPATCYFSAREAHAKPMPTTAKLLGGDGGGGGGRRSSENKNNNNLNNHNSSNTNDNNHSSSKKTKTTTTSSSAAAAWLPWELKQMPSQFDVHDVVHPQLPEHELAALGGGPRQFSIGEGSVQPLVGGDNLFMTPLLRRPGLGNRNFSELTQLELGVGYVAKEKRDTICREHGEPS